MPTLDQHQSGEFTKLAYIGDSGTGKTGSLVSLVKDGYDLGILDMDNGLDSLVAWVRKECPERLKAISYETVRDKFVSTPGGPRVPDPQAMTKALALMDKWSDGTSPATWGPKKIFVLDTLSRFGRAAFFWARGLNPTAKDPRQWYGAGQEAIENMLGLLTAKEFATNVIVISHVKYNEATDGSNKGYMNALGKALGPVIPSYFNTLVLAESTGTGQNVTRTIRTVPTNLVDVKTPAPFLIDGILPLSTGLATIFKKLKEQ